MRATEYEAVNNDEDTTGSFDTASFSDEVLEDGLEHEDGQAARLLTSHLAMADVDSGAGPLRGHERKRSGSDVTKKQKVAAWRELPNKKQLVVITMTRLSEPLVQTSLQSYMFYQLKWFDPSLPDSVISKQAGILTASFTAAQLFTALMWGRIADSEWAGRKTVILIGLLGTLVSCIGFGLSTSFYQALFFRCLGGVTNGNVGVLRTMISEIVREKKYQSRAFLLLPMTFNIGSIVGPVLGGILSDPAGSYPGTFGENQFFVQFPYALPNLVSAGFLLFALFGVLLFLEETHDALRGKVDFGRAIALRIGRLFQSRESAVAYSPLPSSTAMEMSPVTPHGAFPPTAKSASRRRFINVLSYNRILTRNVGLTFFAQFFLAFHLGTFNSLWFVFLSTPVYNSQKPQPPEFQPSLPFRFTGGLGLPPRNVGIAMAMLGTIGIIMQLYLYPYLSSRFGTVRMWRMSLSLFPITYLILPYLSVVPSTTGPPSQKTGPAIWIALAGILLIQVTGRTFALPAQTILVNNCTPHPSVLGTIHGIGQSVSSFARTVGPVTGGWMYGLGLSNGLVGGVFWGLAGIAICGLVASFWVREGNGHEIWLEGDEADEHEDT